MKYTCFIALIGASQAIRFIDNVDDIMNNLVLDTSGVDVSAMQPN